MNPNINNQKGIKDDMSVKELAVLMMEGFAVVNKRIDKLEGRLDSLENRFDHLESYMKEGFEAIDQRFDDLENRFGRFETRFNKFEKEVSRHLSIIDKNMVNPFEFQALSLKVEQLG